MVLSIVFNQFSKNWQTKTFRSHFSESSNNGTRFVPEFDMIMVNLADLSQETLNTLDKYGTLKATLLAMKHVRNKRFLTKHFEDIFVFLQKHPDKTDLQSQLIAYLLGHSPMKPEEMTELLKNIFSPVLKQEVMVAQKGFIAVARAEERAKIQAELAEIEAKMVAKLESKLEAILHLKSRLSVMRGWHNGATLDLLTVISSLPQSEINQLVDSFEKVKNYCASTQTIDIKALKKLSNLNDEELEILIKLLK